MGCVKQVRAEGVFCVFPEVSRRYAMDEGEEKWSSALIPTHRNRRRNPGSSIPRKVFPRLPQTARIDVFALTDHTQSQQKRVARAKIGGKGGGGKGNARDSGMSCVVSWCVYVSLLVWVDGADICRLTRGRGKRRENQEGKEGLFPSSLFVLSF